MAGVRGGCDPEHDGCLAPLRGQPHSLSPSPITLTSAVVNPLSLFSDPSRAGRLRKGTTTTLPPRALYQSDVTGPDGATLRRHPRVLVPNRSDPERHLSYEAAYAAQLNKWLRDCDVRDESGAPATPTPHQFRHTYATVLINLDAPSTW
jgi:hypothetical protein